MRDFIKEIDFTTAFRRDMKRLKRQGKNIDHLQAIIDILREDESLPSSCKDHALKGNWLLVYKITPELVLLTRTGSHAELFGL